MTIKQVLFEKTRNGGHIARNEQEDWHVVINPMPGNRWRANISYQGKFLVLQCRKIAHLMNLVVLALSYPDRHQWENPNAL